LHDGLPAAHRRRIGPTGVGVVELKSADVPTVQMDETFVQGEATAFSAYRPLPNDGHLGLANQFVDEPSDLGLVKPKAIVARKHTPEASQCADIIGSIAELHLGHAKSLMLVNTLSPIAVRIQADFRAAPDFVISALAASLPMRRRLG
jgi:hypothetical protein